MDKKIVEYDMVVTAIDYASFIAQVNMYIDDGWQPHGGPIAQLRAKTEGKPWESTYFYQAIVKYEEDED